MIRKLNNILIDWILVLISCCYRKIMFKRDFVEEKWNGKIGEIRELEIYSIGINIMGIFLNFIMIYN